MFRQKTVTLYGYNENVEQDFSERSDTVNDEIKKEIFDDASFDQNGEDRQEGREEMSKGVEEKACEIDKDNRCGKENHLQDREGITEQAEGMQQKEKSADCQGGSIAKEFEHEALSEGAYAYYAPPKYSTAYSSSYGNRADRRNYDHQAFGDIKEENKPKAGSMLKRSTLAIFLAATLLLGIVAGFFGSILATRDIRDAMSDGGYNIFGSTVTVTKNDGSIKVNEVIGSTGYSNLTVAQVVELVSDSVVEVFTQTQGYGQYVSSGAGSGVIYAQSNGYGYVVTNYHVVGGSDSIQIRLTNGQEYRAEFLDGDEREDIAVIRFATQETLNVVVFGSSSAESLHVGQEVVAIGNPLGQLGGTVTNGIISALNRTITIDGVSMDLLQTNAAVNPGNSGGGLFNMAGELIGIVNAKESSEGIEGLGFAIPIDNVYDMLIEILKDGYIQGRITFGISVAYLDSITAWANYRLSRAGVYITSSTSGSFQRGDLVLAVNNSAVTGENDYYAALTNVKIGENVTFVVVRNGRQKNVTVTAQEYVPGMFS